MSFACFAVVCPAAPPPRFNVLFIACDDLRCDLGCYGDPIVKTPALDGLAERGLLFERAYCQQALCNPSRASLLTGRRPDSLQLWNLTQHFRDQFPDIVTLPQHFQRNGYFCQNIGKVFHNWRTDIQGDPASWSVPAVMHFGRHGDDTPHVATPWPEDLASDPKCECRDVPDEAYYDGRIAARAEQALEQLAVHDQPFFLAVGFWKPHAPFNAPKRYWDLYPRHNIALPPAAQWPRDTPRIAWHNSREILGEPARPLTAEAVREIRHGYLAAISYLDAQVGRLLKTLDRLELTENTIVVFWSDHGYHLGEHTLWAKTSNFELDARVPLIVVAPSITIPGSRTRALVELLDLYPTLIHLCALEPAAGLEGRSLHPVLVDPLATVKQVAFTQHPRPAYYGQSMQAMGYSVRTDRYRYTEWRDVQSRRVIGRELYDHETDPAETVNLAEREALADLVRDLSYRLGQK